MISPNYLASADFLKQWAKTGPWVLVALDPDKKGIEADTFSPLDEKRMMDWLEKQGTKLKRNIYFTVNPCVRPLQTKPMREHIGALAWLHVDLDPRSGEPIDEERSRILKLLQNPTAKGIPTPSVIVFSGGGYQGFWRLANPVILSGKPEDFEEAKRWNQQLEFVLGGDACHNIDRIMRLPGTVNRPNERKRKAGRTEALAEVIEFNQESYDLAKFIKAPLVQGSSPVAHSSTLVNISGNIKRLSSVDELPKEVSPQAKVVIVQGTDPDNPDKFGSSRSEWLFFACCEMVRGGCSDDVIYSVITDPDFGISASVIDKGSGVHAYAVRQIEQAREHAIDPVLYEFNSKHALIGSIGSKGLCRILTEEIDPVLKRERVSYQAQSDFMLRYKKRTIDWMVEGKPASKPAALWWLEHPMGRYYDTVVFAPGIETPGNYNLWKGFAFDADPSGSCELYLEHVLNNICSGNEEWNSYLLDWMAWCVQFPAQPGQVAVVLRGEQGVGKGVFAEHFGKLWGGHFLHITSSKHLVGSFNAHMRNCVVMYADEAFASDDKQAESMLKTLVTESTIVTEAKGVDAEPTANYIHLILASNHEHVVTAAEHERRFFALKVAPGKRQNAIYFAAIAQQMIDGGYGALLALLLSRDVSKFNVRKMPKTGELTRQKEQSLKVEDEWWYDKLQDREVFSGRGWPEYVFASELLYNLSEHIRQQRTGKATARRLTKYLELVTAGRVIRTQLDLKTPLLVTQANGDQTEVLRPYVFFLPPIEDCRKIWELMGKPADWQAVHKAPEMAEPEPGEQEAFS